MGQDAKVLNLTQLVAGGLKKGLAGATKSIATSLVAYGINALFGTNVGPDSLKNTLQGMSDELTDIEDSLTAIEADLTSLMQQLSLTESVLNIDGILDSLKTDFADITTQWGNFTGYVRKGSASNAELRNLMKALVGSNPMSTALTNIGYTLVTGSPVMGDRKGLIDAWVDYAVVSLQSAKTRPTGRDVQSWYLFFENALLSNVQQLYYGMILNVNALVAQGCEKSCADPTSQPCQECLLEAPGADGTDYLTNLFYPMLEAVVGQYRRSIDRFLLRFYDPVTYQAEPEFLDAATLNFVMTRVELLGWLMLANTETPSNPGFCVWAYQRPSQLVGGDGPPIQPPGYASQAGKVLTPTPFYNGGLGMKTWYKCVDFTDSPTNYNLAAVENSNIQTVVYNWPWPQALPPAGEPLGTGLFQNVVPQNYDTGTLAPVATASASTVLFALAADPSSILQSLVFTTQNAAVGKGGAGWAGWAYTSPAYHTSHNTKQDNIFSTAQASCNLQSTPRMMNDEVDVLYNFGGSAQLVQTLQRQVSYPGSNTTIKLIVMATYNAYGGLIDPSSGWTPPASATLSASFGAGSPSTTLATAKAQGNGFQPATTSGSVTDAVQDLPLNQNSTSMIQFQVSLNALYNTDTMLGHVTVTTKVSGGFSISCLRLGWPQPQLTPNSP